MMGVKEKNGVQGKIAGTFMRLGILYTACV